MLEKRTENKLVLREEEVGLEALVEVVEPEELAGLEVLHAAAARQKLQLNRSLVRPDRRLLIQNRKST